MTQTVVGQNVRESMGAMFGQSVVFEGGEESAFLIETNGKLREDRDMCGTA